MNGRGCKRGKRVIILVVFCAILIYFIFLRKSKKSTDDIYRGFDFSSLQINRQHYAQLLPNALKKASTQKFILLWYPPENNTVQYSLDPNICGSCKIIQNRSEINNSLTAAVVFDSKKISPSTMPPSPQRRQNKLFIYWITESPLTLAEKHGKNFDFDEKYHFNATMGYRRDADFHFPYGVLRRKGNQIHSIVEKKSRLAMVFISNCNNTKGAELRLRKIEELIDHGLKLDAYGDCFPAKKDSSSLNDEDITQSYKYYLAFEDSHHCKDYITSDFYRNLETGVVPVVWGAKRQDYEKVAPPDSFIHIEDFQSAMDLVDYLTYLDHNDTAYSQYFRWREVVKDDHPMGVRKVGFCQLCREIHGIHVDDVHKDKFDPSKMYRPLFSGHMLSRNLYSLKKWLLDEENSECSPGFVIDSQNIK
uniref:4-galactosyl-N-acetylglucosaminide 3-alpha-L-fucosyltransferase FUT6-like n=1 Tax=Styela clava TaxID=7725 RepID=UPI001939D238|nr:4-galactosyl-N-acetylglucosaminide 3-alpha-L-fucosyltransferase FUT6-like [Styela clava]